MTAVSTKGEIGGIVLTYFILKYSQLTSVVIVSGIQKSGSVIHIHVSILSQILFPFRLLHNVAQSSLGYTGGLCWLSILSIAVYVCQSQILSLSLPPTKRGNYRHRHTYGRRPRSSPGERPRTDPSLEILKRNQPGQHPDVGLLSSRALRQSLVF